LKFNSFEIESSINQFLFFSDFKFDKSSNNIWKNFLTSSSDLKFLTLESIFVSKALIFDFLYSSSAINFQVSTGLKLIISLSFSTINFTATD
jgi:hypothetical protein